MYIEHPTFSQPENEDVKVWRYMDFTKLISLIDSHRLYFTRADIFNDPFEGSWPKKNVEARSEVPEEVPADQQENYLKSIKSLGETFKNLPRYVAINCWHMNQHESAAMWGLYLKSDEGIALQSTYSKLKKSIIDDEQIFLGTVKYIDYDLESISADNLLRPFVHKRKSFEHEQEIRALVIKWPRGKSGFDITDETIENGLQIKIDIKTLIERIYIAPNAPEWFADIVEAVITRYGYNFEVVHSKMNENPVF